MAARDEDLLRELLQMFHVEAAEHLQALNQSLLKLERTSGAQARADLLQAAFRTAHTLKGAARAVSHQPVEKLAHHMEEVFKRARDAQVQLDPASCDVLYDTLDAIQRLIAGDSVDIDMLLARLTAIDGASAEPPAEPAVSARPAAPEPPVMPVDGDETIRVAVAKLDSLMAQTSEMLISRISAQQRLTDIHALRQQLTYWPKMWREIKALLPRISHTGDAGWQLNELLSRHYDYLQSLTKQVNQIDQAVNRDTVRLGMVASQLQDEVRRIRMIPFHTLEAGFQRAVRDAAHTENKHVALVIEGGEVELDKKVLEMLKDPLLHLLRNAVSHGIEIPDVRAAAGKPAEGTITLSVAQRGGEVRITARDDGRGFNLDALRRAAAEQNSGISAETQDDEIISLAFLPGVTTSEQVTAISGRGIGLDVVRQRIEALQGRIHVENRPGEGASFLLTVPVSLAMTRALLVRIGSERYALPLASVEKIVTLRAAFSVEGQTMLTVDGTPLPLVPLAGVLKRPFGQSEKPLVVIMGSAQQRLALLVDDVLTEQELAVKPLGKPLTRVRNIAGAAVMGSGEPVVVLNTSDLVKSARQARGHTIQLTAPDAEEDRPPEHILVVDDSITTRTLEKNILEAAGYIVSTATDGLEALQQLQKHPIVLVVADVQMPNMDGITLTRQLRGTDEYKEMPIILVTSLESPEDRENGMVAGANAYIVKRGFNQAELLSTIRQLI